MSILPPGSRVHHLFFHKLDGKRLNAPKAIDVNPVSGKTSSKKYFSYPQKQADFQFPEKWLASKTGADVADEKALKDAEKERMWLPGGKGVRSF